MSRPSPLEIQDALFGGALRTAVYATAAIAIVAVVAPWEAGPDGTVWTGTFGGVDILRTAEANPPLPVWCVDRRHTNCRNN